jgi:hypothetical protein
VDPRGTRFRYVVGAGMFDSTTGIEGTSVRSIYEDARGGWWLGTDGARCSSAEQAPGASQLSKSTSLQDAFPPDRMRARRCCARWISSRSMPTARGWRTTRGLARAGHAHRASARRCHPGNPDVPLRTSRATATARSGSARRLQACCTSIRATAPCVSMARPTASIVHAIHIDRRNRVWAGTSDGLQVIEPVPADCARSVTPGCAGQPRRQPRAARSTSRRRHAVDRHRIRA